MTSVEQYVKEKEKEVTAASRIWSLLCGRKIRYLFLEKKRAIIKIQSVRRGRLERLLVMRLRKELADEELREQAEIEAQVAALRAAATKKAQMKKADLVAGAMGRRL